IVIEIPVGPIESSCQENPVANVSRGDGKEGGIVVGSIRATDFIIIAVAIVCAARDAQEGFAAAGRKSMRYDIPEKIFLCRFNPCDQADGIAEMKARGVFDLAKAVVSIKEDRP